jgi:DNA-binding winged helix-turn-helix (wHTH) protein
MPNPDVTLKFGGFEFDLKRSELRKRGLRVRMSASQTRLLTLFLERPGELITRDEITARLWTDTATIDIDTGINTAINRLRTTLNDNPAKPALIETVIGAGYRFIAEVEVLRSETPAVPEPAPEQPTPAASSDASSDAQSIATPLEPAGAWASRRRSSPH